MRRRINVEGITPDDYQLQTLLDILNDLDKVLFDIVKEEELLGYKIVLEDMPLKGASYTAISFALDPNGMPEEVELSFLHNKFLAVPGYLDVAVSVAGCRFRTKVKAFHVINAQAVYVPRPKRIGSRRDYEDMSGDMDYLAREMMEEKDGTLAV